MPNSDIHEDEGQERSEGTQTNIGLTGPNIGVASIKKHKKSASVLNQTHLTEAPQRTGISIRNSPKMSESKNSVVKASVQNLQFVADSTRQSHFTRKIAAKRQSMQAEANANLEGAHELNDLKHMTQYDIHIFYKRLQFIKRHLDCEGEPMRQISRDHERTNRNGLPLDYLDRIGERQVPIPQMNAFPGALQSTA